MNYARTASNIDSPRPGAAQRRKAALVAQYIHELSDRHGSPTSAERRRTAGEPTDSQSG